MPYLEVTNFKYGLDKRKSEMTTNPGSLSVGQDGIINEGGEFEKRKAFVNVGDLSGTFGLVATATGFVVFGDGASAPGTLPSVAWSGGPTITYQRIRHPDGVSTLAEVVHATSFGGKAFVVAKFAQSGVSPVAYDTLAFYDGVLVQDIVAGLILRYLGLTSNVVACSTLSRVGTVATFTSSAAHHLATGMTVTVSGASPAAYNVTATITVTGTNTFTYAVATGTDSATGTIIATVSTTYADNAKIATALSAIFPSDYTISGLSGTSFDVQVPAPQEFTMTPTYKSGALGTLAIVETATPVAATNASYAVGNFSIMAGSTGAGNKVTSIKITPVGSSAFPLWPTGETVAFNTDTFVTAEAVAQKINDYTDDIVSPAWTGTKHIAVATDNVVTIYQSSTATFAPGYTEDKAEVEITCEGDVCCDDCRTQFQAGVAFTITDCVVNGVNILTTTYAVSTTLADMITAMAADINTYTATHGYLACAQGNVLSISRAVCYSTFTGGLTQLTVYFHYTGAGGVSPFQTGTKALIPSDYVVKKTTVLWATPIYVLTTNPIAAIGVGFTPISYKWTATVTYNNGTAPYATPYFTPNDTSPQVIYVLAYSTPGALYSPSVSLTCVAKDMAGVEYTFTVAVS